MYAALPFFHAQCTRTQKPKRKRAKLFTIIYLVNSRRSKLCGENFCGLFAVYVIFRCQFWLMASTAFDFPIFIAENNTQQDNTVAFRNLV